MRAHDPVSSLSIHLFGSFRVSMGGQPLPRLRLHKSQAVLALLALRGGAAVERDWLLGLVWPGQDGSQALRNCLSQIRQALGPEAARLASPTFRTLALDLSDAFVDVLAFDAAMARGAGEERLGHAAARGYPRSGSWGRAPGEALEEAVALYRGSLLEGWTEEWVFQERQPREQQYLTARETLAALARERGDAAAAERHLQLAIAVDPLRESAQRGLMAALAAGGNYAAALLCYRELRERLHRELNTEPDAETRSLFQRLREEAREKAGSREQASIRAADGAASKQELVHAEQIYSFFDPDTAGLLPPPHSSSRHVHNLPAPTTALLGREESTAELCGWLQREEVRLVTLTGPGESAKPAWRCRSPPSRSTCSWRE